MVDAKRLGVTIRLTVKLLIACVTFVCATMALASCSRSCIGISGTSTRNASSPSHADSSRRDVSRNFAWLPRAARKNEKIEIQLSTIQARRDAAIGIDPDHFGALISGLDLG